VEDKERPIYANELRQRNMSLINAGGGGKLVGEKPEKKNRKRATEKIESTLFSKSLHQECVLVEKKTSGNSQKEKQSLPCSCDMRNPRARSISETLARHASIGKSYRKPKKEKE